jgi:hypothetical protein
VCEAILCRPQQLEWLHELKAVLANVAAAGSQSRSKPKQEAKAGWPCARKAGLIFHMVTTQGIVNHLAAPVTASTVMWQITSVEKALCGVSTYRCSHMTHDKSHMTHDKSHMTHDKSHI